MSVVEFCKNGDLEGVKAALKSGANVNTKDEDEDKVEDEDGHINPVRPYGMTGLMWAVAKRHNSMVELLLKTPNIDVNLRSKRGECALHHAVIEKNNEALKLLLNVPNINVNIVDKSGWNALHLAVLENNIEGLKLLLNVPNIDVNIVNNNSGGGGQSALHLAKSSMINIRVLKQHTAVRIKNYEALKLLLNVPNIDVNILDNNGESAVHHTVRIKNNEELKLLLKMPNIDVNIVNNRGWSPLHSAVEKNNIEGLKLLLNHPNLTALSLNHKNSMGYTPVMLAAFYGRLEYRAVLAAEKKRQGIQKEYFIQDPCKNHNLHHNSDPHRLMRKQQRQVSKVLLDGLYDSDSPISKLLGIRREVVGEIIWRKLVDNWQIFPGQ